VWVHCRIIHILKHVYLLETDVNDVGVNSNEIASYEVPTRQRNKNLPCKFMNKQSESTLYRNWNGSLSLSHHEHPWPLAATMNLGILTLAS